MPVIYGPPYSYVVISIGYVMWECNVITFRGVGGPRVISPTRMHVLCSFVASDRRPRRGLLGLILGDTVIQVGPF